MLYMVFIECIVIRNPVCKFNINWLFSNLEKRNDLGIGQFRSMLKRLTEWDYFDPYYFKKINKLVGQKIDKMQPFIQSIISLGNVLTMKSQPPDLIISALYKTTHIFKESQNPFIFRSH